MNDRIDEEIGALLDGRLETGPRTELLARLAASGEDFEVFADTAAVLREAEEGESARNEPVAVGAGEPERPAEVIPLRPPRTSGDDVEVFADTPAVPRDAGEGELAAIVAGEPEQPAGVIPLRPRGVSVWQSPGVRWLAAAAVVAAIALPAVLQSRAGAGRWRDPARLVALSPGTRLLDSWEYGWDQTRGNGPVVGDTGLASMLGAQQVDLEIAARSNDFDQVSILAGRIAAGLDNVPAAGSIAEEYRGVASAAGRSDPNLRSSIAAAREELRAFYDGDVLGDYLAVGGWTEAARLAADGHKTAFFHARESQAALKAAERLDGLSDEGKAAVARLRSATSQREIRAWATIFQNLTLLQHELAR